jgi:hypothetical protein
MLKSLARVLYQIVPHASTFVQRGNSLPLLLVSLSQDIALTRKDVPKQYTRELCQAHYRMMDAVTGHSLWFQAASRD